MVTADGVKAKIQGLIDAANAITGNDDTSLTAAVNTLIAGFESGAKGLIVGNVNLNDPEEVIEDYYLVGSKEIPYTGWSITGYIPVTPGKWYAIVGDASRPEYCSQYDENKNYIGNPPSGSAFASGNDLAFVFVRPSGYYIRYSNATSHIKNLRIYECDGDITFLGDIAIAEPTGVDYMEIEEKAAAYDILTGVSE
jgi:hypothetical protein